MEGGPFLFPPSMREFLLNTDYTPTLLVMTIMSISKMSKLMAWFCHLLGSGPRSTFAWGRCPLI